MAKIQHLIERAYMGVKFALMLDKRHGKADFPLAVRITYDYRQKYILTGKKMSESDYLKCQRSTKGELYDMKKECERIFDRVYASACSLIDRGTFSFAMLKSKMEGGGSSSVLGMFDTKIRELESYGKVKSASLYRSTRRRFEEFAGDITFKELTVDVVRDFDAGMLADGLSDATRGVYLRNLRCVCNMAIASDLMMQECYPFSRTAYDKRKVKVPRTSQRTEYYLPKEAMRKLYEYDGKFKEQVAFFLISYLCNGANIADIARMKYGTRYFDIGEFEFVRRKSRYSAGITVHIPVTDPLKALIGKYGVPEEKDAVVFPQIMLGARTAKQQIDRIGDFNKWASKGVRAACKELGLEHSPSMTYARHSFKTNLIMQGVPERYCEQAMGHVDRSVSAHYVGMFSHEDRMKYNSMLL